MSKIVKWVADSVDADQTPGSGATMFALAYPSQYLELLQ